MRAEIRVGLLLAAAACLVAVMVDWAVAELNGQDPAADVESPQVSAEPPQAGAQEAQTTAEEAQTTAEEAQTTAEEAHDQA